jgi:hypothetical protein
MSWNNTSFSEIGRGCPSQNLHPAGGKLPANIRISPTYGIDFSFVAVDRHDIVDEKIL